MKKNILSDKKYYSIGEVAKFLEVNTSLLRFWEKEFKQISPKKKRSGIRKFTSSDVETLQVIFSLLKEKKMTIEGAKRHLEMTNNKEKVLISIRNKLEKVKSDLLSLRDNM
tara:strand:+ start:479 stop:811 length:333 start_codon:yes stop_codon:yes gene_type:complete